MDVSEHIAALQRDGELLAAAAERAGLRAAVPSCPGWQVRDLLRHISYVHRWAAGYVVERHQRPLPEPSEADLLGGGPPDEDLLAYYRAGHAALVSGLRAADPDLSCWSFLPAPSPLAFWARRQAHETAMHRIDAELAGPGPVTEVGAEFAADGIDELIMGFLARDHQEMTDEQRSGGRRSVQVVATDAGQAWLAELTADFKLAAAVCRGVRPADSAAEWTITGPAGGLYQVLWNRREPAEVGVAMSGDTSLHEGWLAGIRVTWA